MLCHWNRAGHAAAVRRRRTVKEEPDRYQISVITMGPGQELFSRFGHIGLLVEDKTEKTEKVYNFGMYNFNNPALRFKYLKGFLIYWVSARKFQSMIRVYRNEDRAVEQRVLHLAPTRRRGLRKNLPFMHVLRIVTTNTGISSTTAAPGSATLSTRPAKAPSQPSARKR